MALNNGTGNVLGCDADSITAFNKLFVNKGAEFKGGLTTFIGGVLFQNGNTYNARQDYNHRVFLNGETYAQDLQATHVWFFKSNCFYANVDVDNGMGFLRLCDDQGNMGEVRISGPNGLHLTTVGNRNITLHPNINAGGAPYIVCDAGLGGVRFQRPLLAHAISCFNINIDKEPAFTQYNCTHQKRGLFFWRPSSNPSA